MGREGEMENRAKPAPGEPLKVNFDVIPGELQALGTWVVWNYAVEDGEFKKPPFNPKNGRRASVNDSSSWATFEDARSAYERGKWCGVGLVLPSEMKIGVVGIDVDHCLNESGSITTEALHIIKTLDTYTEVSPSGSGIHLWMRGKLPGRYRRRGNVEMYEDGRYITVTGHSINGNASFLSRDEARLTAIYHDIFVYPEEGNTVEGKRGSVARLVTYYSDEQALDRGYKARNGENFRRHFEGDNSLWEGAGAKYHSQSNADFVLVLLLLRVSNDNKAQVDRLFRLSGLMRPKWDRKTKGNKTYGEFTIEKAISIRNNR